MTRAQLRRLDQELSKSMKSMVEGLGHRDEVAGRNHTGDVEKTTRRGQTHGPEGLAVRVRELERELGRKDKVLAEALALVALSKKAGGLALGGRGRLHPPHVRHRVCDLIHQAVAEGARLTSACRLLGLSPRTIQRWRKPDFVRDGRTEARRAPANRLDEHERKYVLELLHSPPFQGLPPRQVVPRLADLNIYLASESTLYRLLREERRVPAERASTFRARPVQERLASAPNQLWSWDITYLKGPERGTFFYLYLVMDVFSRRIMGWRIHPEESAKRAAMLIREVCKRNEVNPTELLLHTDNGRPMRGVPMMKTLRRLGIVPSFSRPRVSNDNAFVESLFHTLKSRPDFPSGHFTSIQLARAWVTGFVEWYNRQHLHSRLGYVTPDDRYFGRDAEVLERRASLYERARSRRPERWSRQTRRWAPAEPPQVPVWVSQHVGAGLLPCPTRFLAPRLSPRPLTCRPSSFSSGDN